MKLAALLLKFNGKEVKFIILVLEPDSKNNKIDWLSIQTYHLKC